MFKKQRWLEFAACGIACWFFLGTANAAKPRGEFTIEDHARGPDASLEAVDLQHGQSSACLAVRRVWQGDSGTQRHFGNGWGDANGLRVTPISGEQLLLWRAGVGWLLFDRQEDVYVASSGEQLRAMSTGWQMQNARGEQLEFDRVGRLVRLVPLAGSPRNLAYDEAGRLASVVAGPGNVLIYRYDAQGRTTRIDGPEGLSVEYSYDAAGRLKTVVNSRRVTLSYEYGAKGELLSVRDSFGNTETLSGATAREPSTAPESCFFAASTLTATDVKLNRLGCLEECRDASGTTRFAYDTQGRLASVTEPGGVTRFEYDAFGRRVATITPDGRTTRVQYNALDLPTLIEHPDGRKEQYQYNAQGQVTRCESAPDDWESIKYDERNRPIEVRRASGGDERFRYDEQNRLLEAGYPDGLAVRYEYSADGRSVTQRWSTGAQERLVYDQQERLLERLSADGLLIRYRYDAAGNLSEADDPLHGKTRYAYAPSGLQCTVQQEDAGRTIFDFAPDGLVAAFTDPLDRRTVFQHHASGQPLLVIRPSGSAWRYTYAGEGEWTGVEPPGLPATSIIRDQAGRVTEIRRGSIAWRRYTYDSQGRLAEEKSPAGMAARCKYDAQGRISELALPEGVVRYEHQADGRRSVITGPDYRLEEQRYADGTLAQRVYQPGGLELRLPRDQQGRAAGIVLNDLQVEYGYDDRGRVNRLGLPGGATLELVVDAAGRPTGLATGSVRINLGYDRADRVTSIEAACGTASRLFAEHYTYDSAGNLATLQCDARQPDSYSYDPDDQLTECRSSGVATRSAYGATGNAVSIETGNPPRRQTVERDAAGRMAALSGRRVQYDAAGNVATLDLLDRTLQFDFDAAGRLSKLRDGDKSQRFGYLPDGDRLWREDAGGRVWYAYAPEGLLGFKDENGTLWLIVRLPGSDYPVALCNSKGQTLLVVADRLGSVRRIVDGAGQVVSSYDFDAWGQLPSNIPTPRWCEYSGMLVEDYGLRYARQRYYCPDLRCFLSPDPRLGEPGRTASHDAYGYAANNPQRYRDPQGTDYASSSQRYGQYINYLSDASDRGDLSPADGAELRRLIQQRNQLTQIIEGGDAWSEEMKIKAQRQSRVLTARISRIDLRAAQQTLDRIQGPRVRLNPGGVPNTGQAQPLPWQRGDGTQRILRPGGGTGSLVATGAGRLTNAYNAYSNIRTAAQLGGAAGEAYIGWLDGPFAEERRNLRNARHAGNNLRNQLIQMLNDPARRGNLPPRADGQPWDPDNPQHFDDLFNNVVNNLNSGRPAFSGIAADPGAKLKAALAEAQGLVISARVYRKTILTAQSEANTLDAQAQGDLQKAMALAAAKGALYTQLLGMPGVAQEVKNLAAAAEKSSAGVTAATQSADHAKTKAENAATTVCGFAGRIGTEAEFDQWRREADTLIQDAQSQVTAAEGAMSPLDAAANSLRAAMEKLKAFKEAAGKLIDLENAAQLLSKDKSTATQLLASAEKAAAAAQQARSGIAGWRTKLDAAVAQLRTVLQPFQAEPQAKTILNQADSLGADLGAENLVNFSALLTAAQPIVDAFAQQIDTLTAAISGTNLFQVLSEAQTALDKVSNADTRQATRDLGAAQAALGRARRCRLQIGSSVNPPGQPGGVTPGMRVKVPAVTGLKIDDAVAAVRKVGLVADPQLTGEFPISGDKTVVNGQDPSAGIEVDAGATVTIGYSATKADQPQMPASDKTEVPDVVNMPARAAYVELTRRSLGADSTFLKEQAPAGKVGTVKSQNPPGGSTVRRNDIVQLEIYGQVVPNVIGWKVDTATDIMSEAGLTVDRVALDRRPATEDDAGRVYLQNPPGGDPIEPDKKLVGIHAYSQWESGTSSQTPPSAPPGGTPPAAGKGGFLPGDGIGLHPLLATGKEVIESHPPQVLDVLNAYYSSDADEKTHKAAVWFTVHVFRYSSPELAEQSIATRAKVCASLRPGNSAYQWTLEYPVTKLEAPDLNFMRISTSVPEPNDATKFQLQEIHCERAVTYRQVFSIMYLQVLMGRNPINERADDGMEGFINNAKKLIDRRFPEK